MIGTILWALIAGTVLGVIGRMIVPGRQNIPWWAMIGTGIVAALLGGAVATWLGVGDTKGIDWIRHIIQIALAALGIAGVAGIMGGNRHAGGGSGRTAAVNR